MTTIITPAPAHQRPSGKMSLSANQLNLVSGDWTVVALDVITPNFTDGIEDTVNHRITFGAAGYYDVKGLVTFTAVVADKHYLAGIRRNGTSFFIFGIVHAAIAQAISASCVCHRYFSATDYVELMAKSNAGVDTVDIQSGTSYTCLSVQRVR